MQSSSQVKKRDTTYMSNSVHDFPLRKVKKQSDWVPARAFRSYIRPRTGLFRPSVKLARRDVCEALPTRNDCGVDALGFGSARLGSSWDGWLGFGESDSQA
jgi:hypothetical protein